MATTGELNAHNVLDRYLPRRMEDFAQRPHNKRIFSKIDLVRVYHEIPVAPVDVEKQRSRSSFRLFAAIHTSFGFRNVTQTYRRFVDEIIRGLDFVHACVDDFQIASEDGGQHRELLRTSFKRLDEHGVIINPAKSECGASEITFLGYSVTADEITPLAEPC